MAADFGGGSITSDAGALLLGATDRAIGLVDRFAACFSDGRTPGRITHDVATLVGQRVFGIALGCEDLIDHDDLRRDPALGAALGRIEARRPGLAPLAGKSTLNRLEHAPAGPDRSRRIGHDPAAIEALFVDLFLDAHKKAPARITLDLDAADDRVHGRQEGRFFHGDYEIRQVRERACGFHASSGAVIRRWGGSRSSTRMACERVRHPPAARPTKAR